MKVPREQSSVRLGSDPSGAIEQSITSKPWEQMPTSGGLATGRILLQLRGELPELVPVVVSSGDFQLQKMTLAMGAPELSGAFESSLELSAR